MHKYFTVCLGVVDLCCSKFAIKSLRSLESVLVANFNSSPVCGVTDA